MQGPTDNQSPLAPPLAPATLEACTEALTRLLRHTPEAKNWLVPVSLPGTSLGAPSGEGSARVVVPFLSIRAFKHLDLRAVPSQDILRTFCSSGSTGVDAQPRRGRHALGAKGLTAYRTAAVEGYLKFLDRLGLERATPLISLVPMSSVWPDSSLAAMMHFLAESGIPVVWSSPEKLDRDLKICVASAHSVGQDVLVFGTSLHHHLVNQMLESRPLTQSGQGQERRGGRLVIVDTGGAKGKTLCLDPAELQHMLRRCYCSPTFGAWDSVTVAGEYGMCELASQAWSVADDLRLFVTSPTLTALTVDPITLTATAQGEEGLLAFLDTANTDSYPAILTEDVGVMVSPSHFRLIGRAPMASVKGCSLRVGGLPPAGAAASSASSASAVPAASRIPETTSAPYFASAPSGHSRALSLGSGACPRPQCFTEREWQDLQRAWDSCRAGNTPLTRTPAASPRSLLIVSAANASIALLYPLWAAWISGYSSVTLSLPGVRDDDPLASEVRDQIHWLKTWLSTKIFLQEGAAMTVTTTDGALSPRALAAHDTVLAFGSDETIDVYRSALVSEGARSRFIGMGHVINALRVADSARPDDVAEDCLAWRGRGCLTPLVVVTPDISDAPLARRWAEDLAAALDHIHRIEFSTVAPATYRLFHWHTVKEILARAEQAINVIVRGACVVADARSTTPAGATLPAGLKTVDPALAGQGLVYLVDESGLALWAQHTGTSVSFWDPRPGFADPHQGKTWLEWLGG